MNRAENVYEFRRINMHGTKTGPHADSDYHEKYHPTGGGKSDAKKNLMKWFGKSKVTNDKGEPLVVYHGTESMRPIEAFNPAASTAEGQIYDEDGDATGVFYFTDSADVANSYAERMNARVFPVYLKMENPLEAGFRLPLPADDASSKEWDYWLDENEKWNDEIAWSKPKMFDRWISQARRDGHDGVIVRQILDHSVESRFDLPSDVYIVFDPKNIKSAIGNSGAYDPDDPRITMRVDR